MKKIIEILPNEYRALHLWLSSGDGDEYAGCSISLAFWKWYITINLPPILKPHAVKVFPKDWDADTVARLGRDYYWNYTERRYGVSLTSSGHIGASWPDFLQIYLGRQGHCSTNEQRWSSFLPWLQWDFVRFGLYDLAGNHFWSQSYDGKPRSYDGQRAAESRVPKARFKFLDFDGEEIEATTHIEEREWHRGEKWFKWLKFFYRPMIRRSLDIQFSKETGPRKGSWKGGTVGHGIDMLPGELHESAFRRYCAEHNMTFIGVVAP